MPPVAANPLVVSRDQEREQEQEFDQEFELDVRISPVRLTPESCFQTHTSSARCCVSNTVCPQC